MSLAAYPSMMLLLLYRRDSGQNYDRLHCECQGCKESTTVGVRASRRDNVKNGKVVQPQFAYKGLKGRAWLIQKPTKFLSLTSLSKEMPVTPGTYIIGYGKQPHDVEKPHILTSNGEGKQLTVEPITDELNQQVNLY